LLLVVNNAHGVTACSGANRSVTFGSECVILHQQCSFGGIRIKVGTCTYYETFEQE
jgi:hypothetical protein